MSKLSDTLRRIFPASLWSVTTTRLWLLTLLTVLWFDLEWCMIFSFITFQLPELWVNALLLSLIVMMPQMLWRLRRTQAALSTALSLLMLSNLLYARTYFNAIPASSYLMAGNLADFTASVIDQLRWMDLGFAAIIIMLWIVACRPHKGDASLNRHGRRCYWGLLALTAAVSGMLLVSRGGLSKAWETLSVYRYYSSRVPMYTVFGSVTHDLIATTQPLSAAKRAEVDEWMAAQPPLDSLAVPRIDNVVIILCESLESWPIGLKVQGKEITPCLNRIVADTTRVFYAPNVVTQVGAGRSIDSQLLFNAGMLPMLSGIYATDYADNTYHTLSKALKELRGARTSILTVDKPHTWNQQAVARAFGIDTLIANTSWVNDQPVGSKRKLGDRSFARQIVSRMRSGELWPEGSNAYMQIVTYSGHNPFRLPAELDSLHLDPKGLQDITWRYLTMTHFTDGAIGTLVDYMRTRPDFDRTLIVIMGDHEGLASDRADALADKFVSPLQLTPLIVINAPRTGRFDTYMGQTDIYPTLLQMAGLTSYPWHGMGRSVLSPDFPGIAITPGLEILGDTTAVSPAVMRQLRRARTISDRIISYDLLAPAQR